LHDHHLLNKLEHNKNIKRISLRSTRLCRG
jgi:hypothetical protein